MPTRFPSRSAPRSSRIHIRAPPDGCTRHVCDGPVRAPPAVSHHSTAWSDVTDEARLDPAGHATDTSGWTLSLNIGFYLDVS